jgi:predicted short-subunit dehydrogenase-like oxidoreductase (DUF2520 family)
VPNKLSLVSIGAGNLASHLIPELASKGYEIKAIYSRTLASAKFLADIINAEYTCDLNSLPQDADFYIISISDDAISSVFSALPLTAIILHTAGSVPISIFEGRFKKYGVLYPLQTFSKGKEISFGNIPFLLEASDSDTLSYINEMASSLSGNVRISNSEERKWIHLSAIFANNFTNYMFSCAYELLEKQNTSFEILEPLILETVKKALSNNPGLVQTGPAIRNNQRILDEHISMLKDMPEWQKLYIFVSRMIKEYHSK